MTPQDTRVVIAGAGLGGLTAAACLLQAGFDVEVCEQAPALGEIGAGIQQSANAMHVMRHLGLAERLAAVSFRPPATQFRIFDTGEVLQELSLAEMHERRHGAPYLQLHRADFHAILAARVRELKPDAIRLNAAATGYTEREDGVALHLADGGTVAGDVLIGADGVKSAIRARIAGGSPAEYTGDAAWRLTVPADRFPADFMGRTSSIWVGPHKHAVVYFLRGGTLLNFVACVEYDAWIEESWTLKQPWAALKADLGGWHDDIQAIVDAADRDACYRWALYVRPTLATWRTGRATLIGDAAHPTLPYLAQGAAMAVEDAAVLTRALVDCGTVPDALALYQHNRMDRTARIVRESHANRGLFHMESIAELKAAFARRNMDRERADWLYSYNPLTVELERPA